MTFRSHLLFCRCCSSSPLIQWYFTLLFIKHEVVIVTVLLIYEYFVLCKILSSIYTLLTVSVVNVCMIMNTLNTMPHSVCMYILFDKNYSNKDID